MRTVAEHVDRRAMVAHLRTLGVDDGQGYLLGRPRPLATLVD
jgi:EAL domain-containing protein (putative c-di-GMP-specific phosphodiesterase class I)